VRFLELHNWTTTAKGLHQLTLLLGVLQRYWREAEPLHLEQALRVTPEGLVAENDLGSTKLTLNFQKGLLELDRQDKVLELSFSGANAEKLLTSILRELELDETILRQALAEKGERLEFSDEALMIDGGTAQSYGEILYRVFTALSRVKAQFLGSQSPLVVWPHHFDLSTLWFADEMDEHKPHLNLGFAPFDSVHSEPYVYAYAYPMPDKFETLPLPKPAMWHLGPWQGMWIPFAELLKPENPERVIEDCLEAACKLLQPKSVR
jgi:Family of unknown function (DUF5996)